MTVSGQDRVRRSVLEGEVLCKLAFFYDDDDVAGWG